MSELKKRLLRAELAKIGFRNARYSENENAMLVNPNTDHVMSIKDCGSVCYTAEYDHTANEILSVTIMVNEIVTVWEKASVVPFKGMSNYRILIEYNGVVLAARDDGEYSDDYVLYYVTWRYSNDRTSLEHGNYTADYVAAKEDFAVRSGLVAKNGGA